MPIPLPNWSKTKTTSKQGFDKVWQWTDKLGAPVNRLSNKLGAEAFWPTSLDKESDKAARILQSFCKDGFYAEKEEYAPVGDTPSGKQRVIKKIPSEVIRKAKGLAIFTTMRSGLWISGAGGSGVLVGRTASGEWSPPSGILLHTAGLGFLVGIDIYDCVIVINTEKALQAFTKVRCTVGGELSAVAGPVGVGGILDSEVHKRQSPMWTYLKSRGFYAGVQVDGTVIIERTDENERFYRQKIGCQDILAGKVRHAPYETRTLMATIKAAQGDTDVDGNVLPSSEPTPGDMQLERMGEADGFGLPAADDPDPFGVRALEMEGLEIKEAGTQSRPSGDAFEYKPSAHSPIYNTYGRKSVESIAKRGSKQSISSIERGTQTEETAGQAISHKLGETNGNGLKVELPTGVDGREIANGATSPVLAKARLVSIPKRIPPTLPPRSPYRTSSAIEADSANEAITLAEPRKSEIDHNRLSPGKAGFDEVSMSGSDYSHEAPISMNDHETDESPPVYSQIGEGGGKFLNGSEEFLSMPNTPVGSTGSSRHKEDVKENVKEDFS
ncbi:hypothetical protein MMC12_008376 [Toensbergia leucococca]|nr:hypothetical protein [Toensbergia leucococca]